MGKPIRILLIDDDRNDRALISRELNKAYPGVHLVEIGTGEEMDAALEQLDYDLVITDYDLKWSNGLEVIRTIKELYPNIPVIMVTGTGNKDVAAEAFKQGSDDYIIKSIDHYKGLPVCINRVMKRYEESKAA